MAYQFVNADQLNADLTSVANAIRTKSKMAVKLQFPGGMANAISGISTGVELNFEVVYGQTAPADPKENTIWICTSYMTDWYFQPAQPENMQPGEVWISTGTAGAVAFNALKQNSILVCPISAKQMLGDDIMEDVAAKTWRNGEWVDWWNGELFDNGNQFVPFTGGWVQNAGLSAWDRPNTGTASAGNIVSTRSISASTINSGLLTTQNAIDLSGYSYLTVVVDAIVSIPYVMVHSFASGDIKNSELQQGIDRTGEWTIDISGLTNSGAYYVTIGGNSGAGIDVSQVKLQR